jgi:hypothetical protein
MNAYEKLNGPAEKQEARDLAIMHLLLMVQGIEGNDFGYEWELITLAAEFLKEKEAERDVEANAYWESEEGKARSKEIIERFSKKTGE